MLAALPEGVSAFARCPCDVRHVQREVMTCGLIKGRGLALYTRNKG